MRSEFDLNYINRLSEILLPLPYETLNQLTELEFGYGQFPKGPLVSQTQPPLLEEYENGEIIPIDGILGQYDPKLKEITIFQKGMDWACEKLEVNSSWLEQVVKYHEWSHAILHLGKDTKGNSCKLGVYNRVELHLLETLANLWTYHALEHRIRYADVSSRDILKTWLDVFLVLSRHQPREYRDWQKFKGTPIARIRNFTHALRNNDVKGRYELFELLVLD